MGGFITAIVRRSGELHMHDSFHGHEDIVRWAGLGSGARARAEGDYSPPYCYIEYSAPQGREADLAAYRLHMDQTRAPDWWNESRARAVEQKCYQHIKQAILTEGSREFLLDGAWILSGDVEVAYGQSCLISTLSGNACVGALYWGSQLWHMCGGRCGEIRDGVHCCSLAGGKVAEIFDGVLVDKVSGSVQIDSVHDGVKIRLMDGGTIASVFDSVRIEELRGGRIQSLAAGATLGAMTYGVIETVAVAPVV